jgi:site-specific DNA recombinase
MFSGKLPPPGSRALISGRFSSQHQNPLSADDQIRVCVQDCEKHGWIVVDTFKDEAKSGRSVKNRTGYLDMMAAACAGEADVICVFSLDRLGRNSRELHDANNRLSDCNVSIFTHDRGVMGRMEFALFAEMAQMESERLAERTTRGARAKAERGGFMGSVPYGYRLVRDEPDVGHALLSGAARSRLSSNSRLEIHPENAKVVLRVNLDFDAGKSPHKIAAELTAEGIPTPNGKRIWHPNTILGVRRSDCGLLRNPIYAGRYIYGKAQIHRDQKTGRVSRHKGDAAQVIENDVPWLRIVPQDVWDRNRERLEAKPASTLRGRRRPTYLLSGLVKCGVCGEPYALVACDMGCTAHRLKACTNARRVSRRTLEDAVLDGLTQRVVQPHIMEWFVPEYLRELEAAGGDEEDRHARAMTRLAEVTREIDNLIDQVKAGAKGYAAQLLNENLETLGAEKERLAREARAGPPLAPAQLTTQVVVERLRVLLHELGTALNGDERDATRAREIIRGFVQTVTVIPIDPGGRPNGKGMGPVRVVVEGAISALVDEALLEKKIMHKRGTTPLHDHPIATFRYYVDITKQSEEEVQILRDVAIISRMLDDADWPVLRQEMAAAFDDGQYDAEGNKTRLRLALAYLRRFSLAKAIRLGITHGWVWTDRDCTDEQWRQRYEGGAEVPEPAPGVTSASGPIGVIRLSGPEAAVVTVGSGGGPFVEVP